MTHHDEHMDLTDIYCTFCGKPAEDAMAVIAGPEDVFICEECVATCADSMSNELDMHLQGNADGVLEWMTGLELAKGNVSPRPKRSSAIRSSVARKSMPSPQALYDHLCESVVGQDEAKRVLSVAVYNHYKRLLLEDPRKARRTTIAKSNVMLIGPSGSGKTLLAQTLADKLQVPFAIADATVLTEAGYVGEDVENILLKLIQAADFDIERAQTGIIYIDEADKIASRGRALGRTTRDVSGEGVQQALLKILEGTDAAVPPKGGLKDNKDSWIHVDTTNILFILGGAFVGLDEIVAKRVGSQGIGFNAPIGAEKRGDAGFLEEVLPDDLSEFGLIPELVGRVPVVAALAPLSESDLARILVEPRDALVSQYQEMFDYEQSRLSFTDGALLAIAREALDRGTGARGLRAICERVLLDTMFELPSWSCPTRVVVTADDVAGLSKPSIVAREDHAGCTGRACA